MPRKTLTDRATAYAIHPGPDSPTVRPRMPSGERLLFAFFSPQISQAIRPF